MKYKKKKNKREGEEEDTEGIILMTPQLYQGN